MLLPDWKDIATRSWSMWLYYALSVLIAVQVFLDLVINEDSSVWLKVATAVVAALIGPARLMVQSARDFWSDEGGAVKRRAAVGAGVAAAVMALALPLVQKWEGLRTEAYQDVVGVWTVCYGETGGVAPGDRYTSDECGAMLEPRLVDDYYLPLVGCAPGLPEAPVEVQAAFTSWAYNVGVGAACRSTLVRKFNAGDIEGACNELPRWNRAGGRVWAGLTNRRANERGLCLSGVR